jgi:nicotinamide-nucleotide amidase
MMRDQVLPALQTRFDRPALLQRTVRTAGIGESMLSEHIADLIEALPGHVKLASLPDMGTVKLRLSASGSDEAALTAELDALAQAIADRLKRWVFGFGEITLEEAVGRKLETQGATLGTAESCTGGQIAARITSIPGSSAWFRGSVVAYDNAVKQSLLGVSPQTLEEHGAVSEATIREMLIGARTALGCDYVLASSGIAGPGGGTPEKPVGLVWIGVAGPEATYVREYRFPGNRHINTVLSATVALHLLRRMLDGQLVRHAPKPGA